MHTAEGSKQYKKGKACLLNGEYADQSRFATALECIAIGVTH